MFGPTNISLMVTIETIVAKNMSGMFVATRVIRAALLFNSSAYISSDFAFLKRNNPPFAIRYSSLDEVDVAPETPLMTDIDLCLV